MTIPSAVRSEVAVCQVIELLCHPLTFVIYSGAKDTLAVWKTVCLYSDNWQLFVRAQILA